MALTITNTKITSDLVDATAIHADGGGWYVVGYPGRRFDKDQASTAMKLAEELARPEPNRALIDTFRRELGC